MTLRRTSAVVHARRSLLAATLSLLALAGGATAAQAASSIAITVGADPVEGVATQLGVTGSVTDTGESINQTYKPTGGSGCAANVDADDGVKMYSYSSPSQAGPFAKSQNQTFAAAGSYLVCAWLQRGSTTVTAVDSKTVQVRIPKLSLTIAAPTAVSPRQTFQVTTTSQAEAQRELWVYVLVDTGRGCPANASAASEADVTVVIYGRAILGGPTISTENLTLSDPGQYVLCGYIHYNGSSKPPEAAATAVFNVVAPPPPPPPPPPCVVPAVVKDEPLAQTKSRLTAASCSAGKVRYVASARYARGSVFKLAPVAGTTLANAAAVDLYVSSGAPCVVPAVPRSRSLTSVKRRLVAAGCTVGTTRSQHSARRKRGRVISLSPATGTRLKPRSTVNIVISSGPSRRR
ncbi:MAG TPA: PASTA domain-containing protein [Baekduia sp.]|jgi:hypothetical protein|nr:PASTA domain-containing protein [Baekduia sp.]